MSEPIWVCSRWNTAPKDGEKYEVNDCHSEFYSTVKEYGGGYSCRLPKSDYVPCPAPEQWEHIQTHSYQSGDTQSVRVVHHGDKQIGMIEMKDGYRVVSLVVERRK